MTTKPSTSAATPTAAAAGASIVRCPECRRANRVRPVPRGVPRCGACRRPLPWLVNVDRATIDRELTASVPVLVDLWAPWCGPCRTMAPVLVRLAHDRAGHLKIAKINIDENPMAATRFGVQSIPLLVLLRHGAEVGRLAGAVPLPRLIGWIDDTLAAGRR